MNKSVFISSITTLSIFLCAISATGQNLKDKNVSPDENLKQIFSDKQITQIKQYKIAFENINSAADFALAYRKGAKLKVDLFDALNKEFAKKQNNSTFDYEKDFKWLYPLLPGFETSLVAEGTMLDLSMKYKSFLEKAKKTIEKSDDEFINLMISTFGDHETSYPKWFNQTWDYGGCSYLGKGIHTKTLVSINNILSKDKMFMKELDLLKENALNDILKWDTFCETKQSVIKEVNQIIKKVPVSKSEKINLEMRLKDFQKPDKKLQFNCNKANCRYG